MLGFGSVAQLPLCVTSIAVTYSLTADKGTLTLNGQPGGLTPELEIGASALSLSGQAATFALTFGAGAGALSLSGQASPLTPEIEATAAALTLTGQSALFSLTLSADAGSLSLSGEASPLTPELEADTVATLSLTGQWAWLEFVAGPGGGTEKAKGPKVRKKVALRQRTIEVEKDGRKKKVGYVDRFAPPPPPPPPPPLEIIPDWLFPDVAQQAEPQPDPINVPLLGYPDLLSIRAEIEAADDERDALDAMAIFDQMFEDTAMGELNKFLAQLAE